MVLPHTAATSSDSKTIASRATNQLEPAFGLADSGSSSDDDDLPGLTSGNDSSSDDDSCTDDDDNITSPQLEPECVLLPPTRPRPLPSPCASRKGRSRFRHRESIDTVHATRAPLQFLTLAGPNGKPVIIRGLRNARMDFSIALQIDGLLHKLLGLRLECDVLADSAEASMCAKFGVSQFDSLGSFCGLFYAPLQTMIPIMSIAATHHACGLFVLPTDEIAHLVLKGRQLLSFSIPSEGLTAIVLDFDFKGRYKSKRRPEKSFVLSPVARLQSSVDKVGPLPTLMTMCSPLVAPLASAEKHNPCPGTLKPGGGVVPHMPSPPLFPTPPSPWKVDVFREFSKEYPHPMVASVARSAVSQAGFDPAFSGRRDIQIIRKNGKSVRGKEALVREQIMGEVMLGRIAGPFKLFPFEFGRTVPISIIGKDKYDPLSERFRLISNFSAGGTESFNELVWLAQLLSFSLEAKMIKLLLALAGPGARFWAGDVPHCFRNQRNHEDVLPYMVYTLTTAGFGREFWVDLCDPFGSRPSEYKWCSINAVLSWELLGRKLVHVRSFVDNFFRVFSASEPWLCEVKRIEAVFDDVGLPLHERQFGAPSHELPAVRRSLERSASDENDTPDSVSNTVKALGWLWCLDGDVRFMICPTDKFQSYLSLLQGWAARSPLVMSLDEAEKIRGIMLWVSQGFPIGYADVGAISSFITSLSHVQARKNLPKSAVRMKAPRQVVEAISFWCDVFGSWDRRCPIFACFSPVSGWELHGKVDACTSWGCGGVLFDGRCLWAFAHEWTRRERALAFVAERESTGFLELSGMRHWFFLFSHRCAGRRTLLESDSGSSVQTVVAGFSAKPSLFSLIRDIRLSCATHFIDLRLRFVVGTIFNQVADLLSHGRISDARCRAKEEFGVDFVLMQ